MANTYSAKTVQAIVLHSPYFPALLTLRDKYDLSTIELDNKIAQTFSPGESVVIIGEKAYNEMLERCYGSSPDDSY